MSDVPHISAVAEELLYLGKKVDRANHELFENTSTHNCVLRRLDDLERNQGAQCKVNAQHHARLAELDKRIQKLEDLPELSPLKHATCPARLNHGGYDICCNLPDDGHIEHKFNNYGLVVSWRCLP